ncbi:hypothetical protein E2F47_01805 [Mycobacterium eburneum]|nr:hypothetical protein [Mycobacterium eburneum]TDH57529.1 hypothetical protein E2F47_01805 [Mycobacterium eburneum]
MANLSWLSDRGDHRVVAALGRRCPACKARPDHDCGWWRNGQHWKLKTGVVHMVRVPEDLLFGRAS